MDITLPPNFFHFLTPVLLITTYLSAFKDGKVTCNRFLMNNFLYLLTSFSIFFSAIKIADNRNIELNVKHRFVMFFLVVILIVVFSFIENVALRHILWILIIIILALSSKLLYEKYDKELIESSLKKMMIIIVICCLIALKYPNLISPSILTILIFGLLFVILFRIIDTVFLEKEYNDMISYVAIFIFSGFIIFDTNRVMDAAKRCNVSGGNPDYLENMSDMFLNILNLFQNIAEISD